ncbi:MAG: UDP-N-acetylmuramoyl-tripeptide--D-alanyl-D-alanine ligase [Clostridia bacterium]|nr:UDP-N-acetylmuramoyl-tripeptide--D-alanyl-D-alanine ligase [Clostridia bacterium]
MKIRDILNITKGKIIVGNEDLECENFSKDTRTIQNGDIYIGIKGEKFDGSQFWCQALDNGADAVIIDNIEIQQKELEKYSNKTIIKVENTLEALYEIAKYKRSLYDIPVIAVTGSVGKTSTKDIIASVVSTTYKTLKTEGNNNNNIGLPLTILKLKDHEALVIEMGMNHFREISLLTDIAKPTLAVITNIGTSHIGNLGSRENILKAKLEILEGMNQPKIIINNDNDLLHKWQEENRENIEIHTFGIENKSDLNAENIELRENGSEFLAVSEKQNLNIKVPVGGEHFVYNALCATLVGYNLGISNKQIQKGISQFELTKKRMDIRKLENGAILINDAYNASYESMKASIEFLNNYTGTRKIAVLGDMFELGEFSEELHRKVGKEVTQKNIDILICAGENSKYIIEEAEKNPEIQTYYFNNNEEIVEKLSQELRNGDVILVKASNGMKFFEICQKL